MNTHTHLRPSKSTLRALLRRDGNAVTRWYSEHVDQIYNFVFFRAGRDPELASDVVHDTFVSAIEKLEDYDPERGAMITWLTYIARNCLRIALRKQARLRSARSVDQIDDHQPQVCAPGPDAQENLERVETGDLVRMAVASLSEPHRWALEQHYWHDAPLTELASSRRMSVGAVKSLLFRARKSFEQSFAALQSELGARSNMTPEVRS